MPAIRLFSGRVLERLQGSLPDLGIHKRDPLRHPWQPTHPQGLPPWHWWTQFQDVTEQVEDRPVKLRIAENHGPESVVRLKGPFESPSPIQSPIPSPIQSPIP